MSFPLYVDPSPQTSTPCSRIAWTSIVPVTARPSGVVLKYVFPPDETWKAPQRSATSPSWTRCGRQSTRIASSAPTSFARAGTLGDVGLVVLAEVGRQGVRHGALLADPRDGHGRVEPSRERDPDALADRERGEDAGHGRQRNGSP